MSVRCAVFKEAVVVRAVPVERSYPYHRRCGIIKSNVQNQGQVGFHLFARSGVLNCHLKLFIVPVLNSRTLYLGNAHVYGNVLGSLRSILSKSRKSNRACFCGTPTIVRIVPPVHVQSVRERAVSSDNLRHNLNLVAHCRYGNRIFIGAVLREHG